MDRRAFLVRAAAVVAGASLPLAKLGGTDWGRMAREVQRFSSGTLHLVNAPPGSTWRAAIMNKAGRVEAYVDEATRVWWTAAQGTFERGSRLVTK